MSVTIYRLCVDGDMENWDIHWYNLYIK